MASFYLLEGCIFCWPRVPILPSYAGVTLPQEALGGGNGPFLRLVCVSHQPRRCRPVAAILYVMAIVFAGGKSGEQALMKQRNIAFGAVVNCLTSHS